MGAILIKQSSALVSGFALPRHRAMGTGFGENDRVAGGCGNSLHEVRNFSLGFAVSPPRGQADIGLMATGHAGKAAIACLHIAHWYVLRGDWLWCGYGMSPAHTPRIVSGSISMCVYCMRRGPRSSATIRT